MPTVPPAATRWVFRGWIAGCGTSGGTRLVLGHWPESPLGPFSDVMVAHPDGRRELLAPSAEVADFVTATYRFDEVSLVPVAVTRSSRAEGPVDPAWRVEAGPLRWTFTVGSRRPLGQLLRAVPSPIGTSRAWATLTDPVARVAMRGVRTIGSAGNGRTEWYAARDLHRISASTASWEGVDLGALAPVHPEPRFGFSSTPAAPSLTRVVTTVVTG